MSTTQLRVFSQIVRDTNTFKNLSKIQKSITIKRTNVLHIQHGFHVAKNIGYEDWDKQSGHYYVNKLIVKELIENEQNN